MTQISKLDKTQIASLYDTYSPMLFGIASEISSGADQAEEILIKTFAKARVRDHALDHSLSSCIKLIKLLIESAHEVLDKGQVENIKIGQFEKTPLLHQLLCERAHIDDYCKTNNVSRLQAGQQMRAELMSIRHPGH